jgi:hypothetical protein
MAAADGCPAAGGVMITNEPDADVLDARQALRRRGKGRDDRAAELRRASARPARRALRLGPVRRGRQPGPGQLDDTGTGRRRGPPGAAGPGLLRQPGRVKNRLHGNVAAPGLAHTEAVCEYLWNSHAAAIACDTFGVEVFPADRRTAMHPFGFLHTILIGQFGMALGELWWLDDLAADCAADGISEMFLVSAPMNAPGGIGSPANAVAIK